MAAGRGCRGEAVVDELALAPRRNWLCTKESVFRRMSRWC
jgi:hypothetical protein